MLAALAAFCGAALAMKPCSEADHAVNFITGEPCPDDAEKGKSQTVRPRIYKCPQLHLHYSLVEQGAARCTVRDRADPRTTGTVCRCCGAAEIGESILLR